MDFETRKRLDALEQQCASILARHPFADMSQRPWTILTGSLATDLSGGTTCSAGFNVDVSKFCKGASVPDPTGFIPTYVTVYRYRRWLPNFGGSALTSGVIYAAGTNGSAIYLPNKKGYAFVPDCDNVTDEDPSDTSDTSDGSDTGGGEDPPGYDGPGYYCVDNGLIECCMFLATGGDLPPAATITYGPSLDPGCDLHCEDCP
jgi:hypothetical protein